MNKILSIVLNSLIILFIGFNAYLLLRNRGGKTPFASMVLTKPTLVIVLSENECSSCINDLQIVNDLFREFQQRHDIDIRGVIFSENERDPKGIREQFDFPFTFISDAGWFNLLGNRNTPLLVGLSSEGSVFFVDTIPMGTVLDRFYLEEIVIDRLHYSRNLQQEKAAFHYPNDRQVF